MKNAATDMAADTSPYYPPREHWYTRFWYPWYALRRRVYLHLLTDTFDLPVRHKVLLGLLVPGLSFRWYGRPLFGWILMLGYGLSIVTFLAFIGYQAGTLALTAMMSIHAASIVQMQKRTFANLSLGLRMLWSLLLFVLISQLVYAPICRQLEQRWFMPLHVRDRVLVVRTRVPVGAVKRGDLVAYRIEAQNATASMAWVHLREGYGVGDVLGVAGDKVSFQPTGVSVNNQLLPLRPYMPTDGSMVVPEKHWFIWPELNINAHGHGTEAAATEIMSKLAMVPETDFVGIPYGHWFWRRQTLR
ncbi:MAG TPA: S26 family signal peptidase [Verrucomicrobiae bacterium]|nr:S26 family signal peptidase [Verrucomicrobiae bacterium]